MQGVDRTWWNMTKKYDRIFQLNNHTIRYIFLFGCWWLMVAQIQVIESSPWCQENQTKSSMRGKQRWFLRRRAHRARAGRRALSSRVASCLVSTGIPLKVLQGYRKWSQSPRRVAISSQLSWSCTFGHWNISRCSVSKLDGQSTCTEVHTRRRSFTSQIPAAAMPTARRTVFFWDNSRALQPKAFLAVGKLDKNHCNTEGLRISGNFFSQNDGDPCTCLLLSHWGCCAWGNSSCTWKYLKSKFRCRWSWKTSGSEGWGPLCSIVSLQKVAVEWWWIWFPISW